MIYEILFVVLMILWLAAPFTGDRLGRFTGFLPWCCVALLAYMAHVIHLG